MQIDPTDLGARFDGVTDDTDAIDEAIQRVAAAGGGRVTLPAAPTRVRYIHARSMVEIVGSWPGTVIRPVAGTTGALYALADPGVSRTALRGVWLSGLGWSSPDLLDGIVLDNTGRAGGADEHVLEDVRVANFSGRGCVVREANVVNVARLRVFANGGDGLVIDAADGNYIQVTASANHGHQVALLGHANRIAASKAGSDNGVTGGSGLLIAGHSNEVSAVQLQGCGSHGIVIDGAAGGMKGTRNALAAVSAIGNNGHGIVLTGGASLNVLAGAAHNFMGGSLQQFGLSFEGGADRNLVTLAFAGNSSGAWRGEIRGNLLTEVGG